MIKYIKYISNYWIEALLAICLFSNLYPDLPSWSYYLLIIVFFLIAYLNKTNTKDGLSLLGVVFIGITLFSSLVNLTITIRLWFIIAIFIITLVWHSPKLYNFKMRFINFCLVGFAITPILNYYAFKRGINYMLLHPKYANEVFTLNFSGFTCNSMWLAAACGIATIIFVYFLVQCYNTRKYWYAIFLLFPLFCSLFMTIVAASRSALALSVVSSMMLVWICINKITKLLGVVILFVCLGMISLPTLLQNSERMMSKIENQEITGQHSRQGLWDARIDEFIESPIFGIGFSATGIGERKKIGRAETGSGWLTILSQSGIIGFLLAIFITLKAFIPIKQLRKHHKIVLYYIILMFLCLHSLFEAYIYQGGWYLSFFFWLLVGTIADFKKYELKLHI